MASEVQTQINEQKIKKMMQKGVEFKDEKGLTSLLRACEEGLNDLAVELIQKGASVNAKDNSGRTPLMVAIDRGNDSLAIMLISNGANISALTNNDVLASQFFKSHPEFVKHIVANGVDGNSLSALAIVIFTSDKENSAAIEAYINAGGNINAVDSNYKSLLMYISEANDTKSAKLLIEKGANVNLQDKSGNTALMKAAEKNYIEIAKVLVDNNANVNMKNEDGKTALMIAAQKSNVEFSKFLLESKSDMTIKDKAGKTSLIAAIEAGSLEIVKLHIEKSSDKEAKLDNKNTSVIDIADNKGRSALMYTLYKGDVNSFEYLLAKGADIDSKDNDGLSIKDIISCSDRKDFKKAFDSHLSKNKPINSRLETLRKQFSLNPQYTDELPDNMKKLYDFNMREINKDGDFIKTSSRLNALTR